MAKVGITRRAALQISGAATRLFRQRNHQAPVAPPDLWKVVFGLVERPCLENVVERRKMNVVLLGRPGAGKGTYGTKLSGLLDVPHISTGDLIREELKKQSALSRCISDTVAKGGLLNDEMVLELLGQRLEEGSDKGERGFILDGFPRTLKQAEILDQVAHVDMAINFMLKEEALVKKCLGRRVCRECGKVFSLSEVNMEDVKLPAIPPPSKCLEKMIVRKDDTEESVRRRLEEYELKSKPVEKFYRKKRKLVDFEVLGSVDETWPRLLDSLKLSS